MARKISDEDLRALCEDYMNLENTRDDVAEMHGKTSQTIPHYIREGIKRGFVSREDVEGVRKERRSSCGRTKLDLGELAAICFDYCFFDDNTKDLSETYNISPTTVCKYLDTGVQKGIISEEQKNSAGERKRKNVIDSASLKSILGRIGEEIDRYLGGENVRFTTYVDFAREFGVNASAIQARVAGKVDGLDLRASVIRKQTGERVGEKCLTERIGFHSMDNRKRFEMHSRTGSLNGRRLVREGRGVFSPDYEHSQEVLDGMSKCARERGWGFELAEKSRKHKYLVENRFYSDSIQEGAIALMLEKYGEGFEIEEGKNFQVNGDASCIFDFLVGDKILEWHPIIFKHSLRKGDSKALKELESICGEEDLKDLRELKINLRDDLAVNYWMSRQEAADSSPTYCGKDVVLLTNERELYGFFSSEFDCSLGYSEFRKEFKKAKEYVKSFKVIK